MKSRMMWCTEFGYGRSGGPVGWHVWHRPGVVGERVSEGNVEPSFFPDGFDEVLMDGGYPIGTRAFETEEEACVVAARNGLSPMLDAMQSAEEYLANARQQLVEERARNVLVIREER